MNKCENCGEKFKLGLKDRVLRGSISRLAWNNPSLRPLTRQTKNYCNPCYHAVLDPVANVLKLNPTQKGDPVTEDYEHYPVTLVFERGSVQISKEIDLLDPYSDNVVHTYVDQNGWTLIEVDDNCGEDPSAALNAITSQNIDRSLIQREVKHFKKLCRLLKA